jgi:CRP-like cAMP-binding protein
MLTQPMPALETRRHQAFPLLKDAEIDHVREFGSVQRFSDGQALQKIGDVGRGLAIVLSGTIEVVQYDISKRPASVAAYAPGEFMGELAQLADRPALVDAFARVEVEALIIRPERLRALIIAEADLGERIMRALILRRVGLLEAGAGGRLSLVHQITAMYLGWLTFLDGTVTPRKSWTRMWTRTPRLLSSAFRSTVTSCRSSFAHKASCCAIRGSTSWLAALAWCAP